MSDLNVERGLNSVRALVDKAMSWLVWAVYTVLLLALSTHVINLTGLVHVPTYGDVQALVWMAGGLWLLKR